MYRTLIAAAGLLALTATSSFAATAPTVTPAKPALSQTVSAKPTGKMHAHRHVTPAKSNKPAKPAG